MKISDFLKIDYETSLISLSYILDKPKSFILLNKDYELKEEESKRLWDIINKRKKSYPLQYAIGFWDFYNINLKVDKRALIPRFETEIIVDHIIKSAYKKEKILDIGAGSGAISLALAYNLKDSEVLGSDIKKEALSLCMENKNRLGLDNVSFIESDLFKNIEGKFDLIISNPPYISEKDYEGLDKELFFEPKSALVGGEDGLDFYRAIIDEASRYLNKDGLLIFEIGYDQKAYINDYLEDRGYKVVENIKDFNDFDRFIICQKG